MSVLIVRTTAETVDEKVYGDWDTACGAAVSQALTGATIVVITDVDGMEYGINAWRKEDNS